MSQSEFPEQSSSADNEVAESQLPATDERSAGAPRPDTPVEAGDEHSDAAPAPGEDTAEHATAVDPDEAAADEAPHDPSGDEGVASSDDATTDGPTDQAAVPGDDDEPVVPDDDSAQEEPEEPTWQRFDVLTEDGLDEGISAAVEAVDAGRCIVLPTDTVYGIGADALQADAVQGLLDAKHRGRDMPPPVLISDSIMVGSLADSIPWAASALTGAFWPGPLTLIFNAQPGLGMDLGETRGTIAVRVPDHDVTRALLRRTGPLAVSSANISGQQASTDAADAVDQLGNSVAVYLDAGPTPGSESSSIVDFSTEQDGVLLRLGALSIEQLREHAPYLDASRFEPDGDQAGEEDGADDATGDDGTAGADSDAPHADTGTDAADTVAGDAVAGDTAGDPTGVDSAAGDTAAVAAHTDGTDPTGEAVGEDTPADGMGERDGNGPTTRTGARHDGRVASSVAAGGDPAAPPTARVPLADDAAGSASASAAAPGLPVAPDDHEAALGESGAGDRPVSADEPAAESDVSQSTLTEGTAIGSTSSPVVDPVVESPVTDPVVESPVTDPVVESPVTDPVVESPVVDPVLESPVVEPVVESPVTDPVVDPSSDEPLLDEPYSQRSARDEAARTQDDETTFLQSAFDDQDPWGGRTPGERGRGGAGASF